MSETKNTLLLVDGNALFYRAYHAFPKELTTPAGEPIGAVYGFTRILLTSIKTLKPACVALCFDMKGPTFRHTQYAEYKATRQKMPEDLAGQIDRLHQIVEFLEIPIYKMEGYEADDIIGTLSRQAVAENKAQQVIILTGDQDILQLVNPQVGVYMPASPPKQPVLYTPEAVMARYNFAPMQMIEYKALRGDPSDNIPGVPGVGEVTATKLIQEFGDIEHLYTALKSGPTDSIKTAMRQKLVDNEESARMSHDLATIRLDAPVELDMSHCQLSLKDPEKLLGLFHELGFKSLIRDLPLSHNLLANAADIFTIETEEPETAVAPARVSTGELSTSDEIDAALEPVLRKMESRGVAVDCAYLRDLEAEFKGELEKFRAQLIDFAGEEFNPDSPGQVGHILYEVLHIPTTFVRKGKTGFTTDASTLQELAKEYPIAQLLLQYRELNKLQNTYVLPLQTMVDEHNRIHTSYAPDTATGRLSSRNPNLQNIPVRSEQGRRLRRAFIASPGCILISADYSQMELRVAAHLADDPAMKEVFRSGGDFHAETAARMGVDRRTAKILNFSILYGKGPFGFAKDLNIPMAEAKQYIDQYFRTYKKLREYLDTSVALAKQQGYLETLYGRRRLFPEFQTGNHMQRAAAEREAVNMPIQGTQADILKRAMCLLDTALTEEKLTSSLILTVHDELVLEVPLAEQEKAAALLCEKMIGAAELSVPVEVTVKMGPNWAELTTPNVA